jgi:hypothetical protein
MYYEGLYEEIHELHDGRVLQPNVMNLMVKETAPHRQSSETDLEMLDVVVAAVQG